MPFFSVIVATYNHAHLLPACIQSVLDQTFDDWEMIIVNNHSTDNTIEVVESYMDKRIRIVPIYNDGILAKSRNVGIREAKGEWICMLDSDDVWYKDKLKRTYETIKLHKDLDVVTHDLNAKNMLNGSISLMKRKAPPADLYRELILFDNLFLQTGISYRRSFLSNNNLFFDEDEMVVTAEDYDFTMQLANMGAIFVKINEALGEWRIYKNNWSSASNHLNHLEYVLRKHVFNIQTFEPNKEKLWHQVHAKIVTRKALSYIKAKKYTMALKELIAAITLSPMSVCRYIYYRLMVIG